VFGLRCHLSTEMTKLGRAYEIYIDEQPGLCMEVSMFCEKVVQHLSVIS
jgi:hypothetical protein